MRRIWRSFKENGTKSIVAQKRGSKKKPCRLNSVKAVDIRRLILIRLPDQLKLPYSWWTRTAVQQLIFKKYGIALSVKQVGWMLKVGGFKPQKPIRKAFEQSPQAVAWWLHEEYRRLKRSAKRQRADIYFGDETGMCSDHQAGRSYGPKGKTPVIKATGKRFSANLIMAMTTKGHLKFRVVEGRFNAGVFQAFLAQLIGYKRQKLYFITDGHPAHKAKGLQ